MPETTTASTVAAPVFGEIASGIFTLALTDSISTYANASKSIKPASGNIDDIKTLNNNLDLHLRVDAKTQWVTINGLTAKPIKHQPNKTPNLVGMAAKDALYALEVKGYRVKLSGYGRVVEQSPSPNTPLKPGNIIYLKLGI